MKHWFLGSLLLVVAIAPVSLLIYNYYFRTTATPIKDDPAAVVVEFEPVRAKELEPGAVFSVRSCKILDGYRFYLYLEGGKVISAHLSVATKDGAATVVPEIFRTTSPPPPTATLLRKVGDEWIVRLHVAKDGKRTDLLSCLRERGLLLE
jgi:hypothetical protein